MAYAKLASKVLLRRFTDEDTKVYRLSFIFEDGGKTHAFSKDTQWPAPLVDDAREQIVFMADDPLGAELVDALPGRPRIREDNSISPADHAPGATAAVMLLGTALVVEAISAYLWLR